MTSGGLDWFGSFGKMFKRDARKRPRGDIGAVAFTFQEPSVSTRQAMKAELDNIESLTVKILGVILIAILAYAGANWWNDGPRAPLPAIAAQNRTSVPPAPASLPPASTSTASTAPPSGGAAAASGNEAAPNVTVLVRPGFLLTVALYGALLLCAVITGGLLGFLFGIPRQSQRATPVGVAASASLEAEGRTPGFAGNTNLEEISDWLTKIIVGLGLTQAANLYIGFDLAKDEFVSLSMAHTAGADSMFVAVVLSGLILGFLALYMETRTRVALLLVTSDHVQSSYGAQRMLAETARDTNPERVLNTVRITSPRGALPQSPPSEEDWKIAALPIEAARDTNELIAWVMSQVRTRNFAQAEKALTKAIADMPERADLQTALAAVKNWAGKPKVANEILDQAAERFPDNTRVWKDKLLASLYLKPPESYIGALTAADALKARDPTASNDPFVWLWIACAYGQKYGYLPDEEQRGAARTSALEAVRAVISNSQPGSLVRQTLRKVYDPGIENSDPLDNDLQVFHGDADFAAEIAKAV